MSDNKGSRHINEMSPELLWKAAAAQRRKLKDEEYLKSITAFDYIKKLKRVSDFEDYADEIVSKINSGEINNSIPNEENKALKAAETAAEDKEEKTGAEDKKEDVSGEVAVASVPLVPLDIKARKAEMKKAPAELKFMKVDNPVINRTSDFDAFLEGEYVIVYISNLDDDKTAVWLRADSKADAANEAIRQFWDVKEIVSVCLKRNYKPESFSRKTPIAVQVINPADFKTPVQLADACAQIVSGGEFGSMTELVADIKDDRTTENTTEKDEFYEGQDIDGGEWSGNKSSVRMICESEDYDWAAKNKKEGDFPIEIVTKVNPKGKDTVIKALVTAKMMKKALSRGVVHIVFMKADGSERQAYATTNQEVLDRNDAIPLGSGNNYLDENHVRFYDMTIRKWRSFLMERLTMVYDESY